MREEGGRSWRAVEEGVGCQEEATNGADYSGTASTTTRGLTCQAWSVQEPHEHDFSHYGDHNYCRNLDGATGGLWCYTTDPNTRWEKCPVPICKTKILDFTVDWNWKYAILPKNDFPPSFTFCDASTTGAGFMSILDSRGPSMNNVWASVFIFAQNPDFTEYRVKIGPTNLLATTPNTLFPPQWARVCVSRVQGLPQLGGGGVDSSLRCQDAGGFAQ